MNSDKSKKKIVYIVNHLKHHGGIEKLVSNKIDAWIDNYNYAVTVITLNQNGSPIIYPPNNEFKLIDLNLKNVNNHNILDLLKFRRLIQRHIREEAPDLVITTISGIPSILLPLFTPKTKKIIEFHTHGAILVSKSWKYKWWFYNKYDYVALSTEGEKKYHKLKNTIVLPNFVKIENDDNLSYTDRPKKIITAGRIDDQKQLDHIIKIWEKIAEKHPDWSLDIYGQGDEALKSQYVDYINKNDIKRISILPPTSILDEVMRNSSIYCLTSKYECFPMVLLQCKNNMLPAISYDTPNGPKQIISNDGILVEHNNINEFAKKLEELILNEEARIQMAKNAYENRHQFSSAEIIKMWNNLI